MAPAKGLFDASSEGGRSLEEEPLFMAQSSHQKMAPVPLLFIPKWFHLKKMFGMAPPAP
jgi:hypothetical protein